jgi:alpha-galactosidase
MVEKFAHAKYLAFGDLNNSYYEAVFKHAGLHVIHADGGVSLRLKEKSRNEQKDAVSKTVAIHFKDEYYPFEVIRYIKTWNDCGVVETWLEIKHNEPSPVKLVRADSYASRIPFQAKTVKVMSLAGQGNNEANLCESKVDRGQYVQLVSNAGTRDAWESNPGMMVSFDDKTDEENGRVLGLSLEWSGTNCRRIRRNWDGKITEIFAGVDMTSGPYTLDPEVVFTTPKALLVWSDKGRGEVSRQYHRWARRHLLPHGDKLHPVLLNSWEGCYFSFKEQTLIDMMDGVKELGGEMFVLDDGWFANGRYARVKASRGLGDWVVNTNKLPRGLGFIASEANKRGLDFGIWVEPEMGNMRSELCEKHPEWILNERGRKLIFGRGKTQVTLDYTNPELRDNIFNQLDKVFSSMPTLKYVKWDCNANIWNLGSSYLPRDRQANLWYDYNQGYIDLLRRLQQKRPDVMVQACASGGGRMDFGSLRYADEFWTSDCTDPVKRIFIQWGASQFYPALSMACHVTASPNHQTKRRTPLKYRFDVAMTGRLGFELHPKKLTAEEIAFAKAAVNDYKRIRPVVQRGDLYRLVSPYEYPLSSLMYVSEDKSSAVLFALGLKINGAKTQVLKVRGLDANAKYSVKEINCGKTRHAKELTSITGKELMENGISVTLVGDYDSAVFEINKQK